MIISRDLAAVEAVYQNVDCMHLENYWFSYRSNDGAVLDAFGDRIKLSDLGYDIKFCDILSFSLHVPSVSLPEDCKILVSSPKGDISFAVDTVSNEKFLDIFTVYKALNRRIAINKSSV